MEDSASSSSSSSNVPTKWTYKNGNQFPLTKSAPRKGSILETILVNNLMIEVLDVKLKGKKRVLTVYCHSCQKQYAGMTFERLQGHVFSNLHVKHLSPEKVQERKEQAHRHSILSSEEFVDFIVLHEDQTLSCKYCNEPLPFLKDKLSAHRHTLKHKAATGQTTIDLTESERLSKIRAVVRQFPDVVGMVTDMDVYLNENYYEHYKEPEQITLQVNDIFCKICRRKFVRTNPSFYRSAILDHLKTKQHQQALKNTQQATGDDGNKPNVRPAKSPPKKISTYRHDPEDLREAVRHTCEGNLSASQCSKTGWKIIQSVIGRSMSATTMSKGFTLVNSDITNSMAILKSKNLGITADEASIQGNLLNVSIRALDDQSILPFKRVVLLQGSANSKKVAKAIIDVLLSIWPSDQELQEHQHQVRTLMTDGAAYMKKAAALLREFGFSRLIHSQCVVHGLSLVCQAALKNHELIIDFSHSVQSTMSLSIDKKDSYHKSSNKFFDESLVKLLYEQSGLSLDGKKKRIKTDVEFMVKELDSKQWPSMTDDKKNSKIWDAVRAHAVQVSSEGGETAEVLPEDRTPPPRGCDTRFATELVLLSYCHHFFIQLVNYSSKLEKKTSRKEDKGTIAKLHQQIANQGDEIKERLEYVYSVFSELPIYLCELESQNLPVSQVKAKLSNIRKYLNKGLRHPLEEKYGSVQAALTKLDSVDKRVEHLFEAVLSDPVLESAPCHSIEVEADFSVIRYLVGHRKHFSSTYLSNYVQVVLTQKAVKRSSELTEDNAPKPSKQRRFFTQENEEKRLSLRKKKFAQKTDPLQDHTYARPSKDEPVLVAINLQKQNIG